MYECSFFFYYFILFSYIFIYVLLFNSHSKIVSSSFSKRFFSFFWCINKWFYKRKLTQLREIKVKLFRVQKCIITVTLYIYNVQSNV